MAALTTRTGVFMAALTTADTASTNTLVADAFPTAKALVIYLLASIGAGEIALQQSLDGGGTWVNERAAFTVTTEEYVTVTNPVGMYRFLTNGAWSGDAIARYEVKG